MATVPAAIVLCLMVLNKEWFVTQNFFCIITAELKFLAFSTFYLYDFILRHMLYGLTYPCLVLWMTVGCGAYCHHELPHLEAETSIFYQQPYYISKCTILDLLDFIPSWTTIIYFTWLQAIPHLELCPSFRIKYLIPLNLSVAPPLQEALIVLGPLFSLPLL